MRQGVIAATVMSAALALPASADHWMQTADPNVVQALNELVLVYGGYCQQGNPQACQMVQSVQAHGGAMLNAGYECQVSGNQQACAYYRQAYGMLEQTYMQTTAALRHGQIVRYGGGNPLGATHAERMQAIQNWGQERLQWGQRQSDMMDRSHESFMRTLRE